MWIEKMWPDAPYYTDGEAEYFSEGNTIPVSTAIARIYTSEGFVIAADGRQANGITRSVVSDSICKIFGIQHGNRQLTYAIAGPIGFRSFSFVTETAKAVEALKESRAKSLWQFSVDLMRILSPILAKEKEEHLGDLPAETRTAEADTFIFLDGYYDGRPKRARIKFHHHGVALSETEEDTAGQELDAGHDYGSVPMIRLLAEEDDRLAAFRPSRYRPDLTLQEGITIAANRIRAHCDPIAMTIDPEHCWAMGGRIHLATVTFTQGFAWVPGFTPAIQQDPKRDP